MNSMQKYLYDVFISYHHKDQAWIESELLPRLESAGLRVCIASRDFSPGKPKVVNMQDAVRSSCFTLLVVTPSWIEDDWGQYQSILSVTQDPGGGSGRTIPIILKQCDIPAFLSILTSVDFTRPEHREEAWHSLFTALGVKSPEPIPTAEQKAAGGGDALPPREYFRSYALSNDLTARRIVQEMCSELPPSYYDFIRQYLLPSGTNLAEDPFASKCLSGNTHIVSRGDLEQQFQQAISSKNDILVRGRIGSGKSTLINRGPALIGENSLAVSWMITSDEVAPDEIRFHLTPQMLARRIFLSYWEALWAPPSPGCPTSQISPNWSLLDMLKWFHVRYTLDDSRIPPGLKLEDWKSDPRHQIEFLPDTLKTLLRVVSSSMDTPAGATEDNTRERKRRELRKMMDDRLSSNELRTICFDCDFNLRETPLASIDVIGYCEKHEPEAELNLLQWLYENRSDQKWPNPWGVMPEPGDMQEISFEQIWIFVDGTDRLALSTQVRFIKEARAISKAYAPNLHFVIAVSDHVQAQMMGEGHSAEFEILDLSNNANRWTESLLVEMINRRLATFGADVPTLEERLSSFPLRRQAQQQFLHLISDGACRAYKQNDAIDVPVHALRLVRGALMACAGHWAEHGFRPPLNQNQLQALVEVYWQHKPAERRSHMDIFYGRKEELDLACGRSDSCRLLTFYGEAGIGKTRLLNEIIARFHVESPRQLVAYLDFMDVPGPAIPDPATWALRTIAQMMEGKIPPSTNPGTALDSSTLVKHLIDCDPPPVMMFDTTEKLQTDTRFWEWLESEIVRPLLMAGRARLIFAGRVPAPWRDYDVRRQNQIHRLAPLPTRDDPGRPGAARALIREVIRQSDAPVTEAQVEILIELILEFSHGHPGLSKQLAEWAAAPGTGRWPAADHSRFGREMAEGPVKEFIDEFLFKDIDAEWRLILRWASILNWFDAAVLRQYLEALVAAGVISRCSFLDNWDSFFVPGIDRLRLQDAAVVWEKAGYRLHGVTHEIVRQWLRVTDPIRFAQANRCAGQVIAAVADEFAPDEEEFARYKSEAEVYFQQAQGEAV